ncbi:TetR family transcriptional regulator [Pullulanibacillus camelliae]|uniref:TetR family transcriptional regulator n=1 Tax=Pullulanibacillus camelliae TaxID=1707096 RepID=A0A8J2VKW6_9BACL|nr:TetR/AcrR family transcriptional regulator [Pullulanibacillus camelliae]GGE35233.1 TetR family transcriptional regulator [Pullulanibacillus camelliae]
MEAIFQATVQLVNEIGFADTTISKIAKRAKVSVATIYIYYENKEDMLLKTYLKVKEAMSHIMFEGFDPAASIKERLDTVIRNYTRFIQSNKDYFLFLEQIMNSPLPHLWCLDETEAMFKPIYNLFEEGQKQQLLKPVDVSILIAYAIYPVARLIKQFLESSGSITEKEMETLLQMSWDAVKA